MRGRGDSRFAWTLAAIVVLGAAIRVLYAFTRADAVLTGDPTVFSGSAIAFVRGFGWIDPFTAFDPQPTASHPPLYTLWISIPAFFADNHVPDRLTTTLWSCIPGTGTILLLGLAGREVLSRRYALIVAGLAAIYPGLWVYDGLVLSETMAMFTVAGVVLFAYRYWNHPSWARAAWLGAWCGLAALSRSELILTFPFVLLPLVAMTKGRSWKGRVGWLAMAAAIGLAVISPWLIFNNTGRFHHRVGLTTSAGRTMAAANCAETYDGALLGFKSYGCLRAAIREAGKHTVDPDESDNDKELGTIARDYMKDHFTRIPAVVAARWGRLLEVYLPRQEIELNSYYRHNGHVATELQFWSFYLVAALAVVGAFVLHRRRVMIIPLLAMPAVALVAVATTFAQWRYRATMEPALVMLAAGALLAAGERFLWSADREGSGSEES